MPAPPPLHTFLFLSLLTWRMNSRDVNPLSTPRWRIKRPFCVGGRNSFELIAGRSKELGARVRLCRGWGEHPPPLSSPRKGGRDGQGDGDIRGGTILQFMAAGLSLCHGCKNANHVVCGPGLGGSDGHSERVGDETAPLSSFGVLLPIKRREAPSH